MRRREVRCAAGRLSAGARDACAWLELVGREGSPETLELTEGELLMAVEALAAVYAEVVGADPASIACGINRTLCNRTKAARASRAGKAA